MQRIGARDPNLKVNSLCSVLCLEGPSKYESPDQNREEEEEKNSGQIVGIMVAKKNKKKKRFDQIR